MWQQFITQLLVSLVANGALLMVLIKVWLDRYLKRYEKQLDRLNGTFQTRFSKYHIDSVDVICRAYAQFVEMHDSVFRKAQILMDDATIAEFEKSFRFLQQVFLKKDVPHFGKQERVQVAMSVYADMTKTFPGMLWILRQEVKKKIGPEQIDGEGRS